MTFAIVELKETEKGGYAPRGAAADLWRSKAPEVIIAGPAETGKTWACMQKLDALMWKYPGSTAAVVRKTYKSMHGSVLQTYRRVIGKDSPIKPYGGEHPEFFQYPNGSRIYVGGMDNPQKVLSSERDFICINQAEELELSDFEIIRTRNTGRGGVAPYAQTFGDANPGPPTHWIKQRAAAGHLSLLTSRHEDNPTLYSDDGKITEQGKRTMAVLDTLTGVRYKRLRQGIWAGSEGMVYEEWNPAVHVIDRRAIPKEWVKFRTIDFGFVHPFVCQWWAQDGDGRLYLYREMYGTQRLVQDWAALIWLAEFTAEQQAVLRSEYDSECAAKNVPAGDVHAFITWLRNYRAQAFQEQYVFTLSDHDSEDRATLERYGIYTQPAPKEVSPGIQAVQSRLRAAGDGKPRLFVFRDALVKADEWLMERRMPLCLEQEFESYVWAQPQGALLAKEVPEKKYDHGADAMRYLVYRLDGKGSYKPAQYKDGFFF